MLCIISLYLYICIYIFFLTDIGIYNSARVSKIAFQKNSHWTWLEQERWCTLLFSWSSLSVRQQCCPWNLGSRFTPSSWGADFSVELTVSFQRKQLLVGIQQLVQTECFGPWQPPSSKQTEMSYKSARGAPKSTFFGKGMMDFLSFLWHLRSCFLPAWTETGIRNNCFSEASVPEFPFHLQFPCLHLTPQPNIPAKVFWHQGNVKYHLFWPRCWEKYEGSKEERGSSESRGAAGAPQSLHTDLPGCWSTALPWELLPSRSSPLSLWVLLQEKFIQCALVAVLGIS